LLNVDVTAGGNPSYLLYLSISMAPLSPMVEDVSLVVVTLHTHSIYLSLWLAPFPMVDDVSDDRVLLHGIQLTLKIFVGKHLVQS
jgi:hypothetical protein